MKTTYTLLLQNTFGVYYVAFLFNFGTFESKSTKKEVIEHFLWVWWFPSVYLCYMWLSMKWITLIAAHLTQPFQAWPKRGRAEGW